MAKPGGQRFDLFAELSGESQPAELERGRLHEGEQGDHLPEVAFGPEEPGSLLPGLEDLAWRLKAKACRARVTRP